MSGPMRLVHVDPDGRALMECLACHWEGYSSECPRDLEEQSYALNSRARRRASKGASKALARFDARRASPVDLSAPALPWREKRRV